jgi:hypothetical protein
VAVIACAAVSCVYTPWVVPHWNVTFTAVDEPRDCRDEPGTYMVYVNNVPAGNFTVKQVINPDIILVISLLLITLSLVLGFIYIWRRREYEY